MNVNFSILLASIVVNGGLGLIVLLHNCRPVVNRIFLGSIVFVILTSLANYEVDASGNAAASLMWLKLLIFFGYCFIYLFFLFITLFPDGRIKRSAYLTQSLIFAYALIASPAILFSGLAFTGVTLGPEGLQTITFGPLYLPLFIGMLFLMGANIWELIRRQKELSPRERSQFRIILAGWLLFAVLAVVVGGIVPFFWPEAVIASKIMPLFSIFMVGATTYAIIRHEFLDIRIIAQWGLIYTALLALIVGSYLGLVFFAEAIFERTAETAILFSGALTVLLGIFGVPPIERFFRKLTDPIFFKNPYNYRTELRELSEHLHRTLDRQTLLRESSVRLAKIFHALSIEFSFVDEEKARGVLIVPIELDGKMTGRIFIGGKRSGDPYTQEDRALLQTFSHQLAVALERADLYGRVREHSRELEEKVLARTAELERLRKGERETMIEIAHNLQTPLTIVKSEVELLREGSADPAKIDGLGRSIDRTSKFIYDLLSLARLESGSYEPPSEPIDASALLEEMAEYLAVLAEEKLIAFKTVIDPDIRLRIPKTQLESIATNLISNAFKYTAAEDGKVDIVLKKESGWCELVARDNGSGIRAEDAEAVFDRFRQVNAGKTEGSGLGLAIVKAAAELYGGSVKVESAPGKGASFTVRLPLA